MMHEPTTPRRSFALPAWILILIVCGFQISMLVKNTLMTGEQDVVADGPVVTFNEEMLGKVVVGGTSLGPEFGPLFLDQIKTLKDAEANWGERLTYIILFGEIEGPDGALLLIEDDELLAARDDGEQVDQSLVEILTLLLGDRIANRGGFPSLDEEQREVLTTRAGWLGRLALLPSDAEDQAAREALVKPLLIIPIIMGVVVLIMMGCGAVGLVCLIVFGIRANDGRVMHGFRPDGGRGGIYAETFACWILLFFGIRFALDFVGRADVLPQFVMEVLGLAGFFLSLLALVWPVIRGVSWSQVRQDIGWKSERGALRELPWGAVGYTMVLPFLGVGIGLMFVLILLQERLFPGAPPPTHPAQGMAATGELWVILQLYVLACIAAPLVEETIFRGVLYRHLREASRTRHLLVSGFFSALFSSLIFAALHPQGIAVIPSLASLAIGFCLLREWRGSLIPAMIAHGFHNFLLISMLVAIFGSG